MPRRTAVLDAETVRRASVLRAVVSHESAALAWGLDLPAAPTALHLTVPRNRSALSPSGVVLHRADLPGADVVGGAGRVTAPVRTVLDLARTLPLPQAVAVGDAALRVGVATLAELVDAAAALSRAPGSRTCREVVSRLDPRSGSYLESLGRLVLEDGGLAPFMTQHVVVVPGGRWYRTDVAWPERKVAAELDGFAFHADRVRYRADRRRSNALALAGWTVLRFTWEDVLSRPGELVAQVRAALDRAA